MRVYYGVCHKQNDKWVAIDNLLYHCHEAWCNVLFSVLHEDLTYLTINPAFKVFLGEKVTILVSCKNVTHGWLFLKIRKAVKFLNRYEKATKTKTESSVLGKKVFLTVDGVWFRNTVIFSLLLNVLRSFCRGESVECLEGFIRDVISLESLLVQPCVVPDKIPVPIYTLGFRALIAGTYWDNTIYNKISIKVEKEVKNDNWYGPRIFRKES